LVTLSMPRPQQEPIVGGVTIPTILAIDRSRLAALALLILASCSPAATATPGTAPRLFVANALDGTIAQLDPGSGRAAGPVLPAGRAPEHVAPGPAGSLLVLSMAAVQREALTQLIPDGTPAARWTTRTVPLGAPVQGALLAADGGRWAAVAYQRPHPPAPTGRQSRAAAHSEPHPSRCSVALVDAVAGVLARTVAVCGQHETLRGLALDHGPAGPTAYLALDGGRPTGGLAGGTDATGGPGGSSNAGGVASGTDAGGPGSAASRGRIVAVDVASGAVVGSAALGGTPTHLVAGPAPWAPSRRVYCLLSTGGPEQEPPTPSSGQLLALHPATLAVEAAYPLDGSPVRLAIAPDGDRAFLLTEDSHALLVVDLTTGRRAGTTQLPERGTATALVAGRARLFVASAYRNEVWAVDHQQLHRVQTIPTGKGPVALLLSST
jgi:hypothetical protein